MENKLNMHSVRVAYENWYLEDRFSELLQLLEEYPCGISQVALFTSIVHAPLPISVIEERAAIMELRMETLRERGFSAGINILGTIGHHEEDLDECIHGDYYNMTNPEGEKCRGSYCMNDTRFLNGYIKPVYKILAEAAPDFIWIDDDIRYGHLPVGLCCFCDGCIKKFNTVNGTQYTRKDIVERLSTGDIKVRKAWLSHNSEAINNLMRIVGTTVRAVDDEIVLGFMTGERYHEGYDFAAAADALSDGGKYEIMWRPGGGAYEDYRFDEIVQKAEQIGRQNAYLPEYVTIKQSEIENFPYQQIKKTPTSTALEAALTMVSGCTGAAFNILPSETGEPISTIKPHLKAINKMVPFYRLLAEKIGGAQPVGIHTGWRPDCQAAVPNGNWCSSYGGMYSEYAREMFDFGLPQSYAPECSVMIIITGKSTQLWTDEEIIKLLSGGVYMDAAALDYLNSRGFGEYTGFEICGEFSVDARERYLKSSINGGFENGIRNCRQAFHPGDGYGIAATKEGTENHAELIDYHCRRMAASCMGTYENTLGGKMCVSGYYPFSWVSDIYKTTQLKRLFVYISDGALPSYVENYCRIRNSTFIRDGKTVVVLCNPTNEPLEDISVAIKTESPSVHVFTQKCCEYTVDNTKVENGYRSFNINEIPPYEMVLIET